MNQGPQLCCKFAKNNYSQYHRRSRHDEYTKIGLILSIRSKNQIQT